MLCQGQSFKRRNVTGLYFGVPRTIAVAVLLSVTPAGLNSTAAQELRASRDFRPIRLLNEFPAISDVPIIGGNHAQEAIDEQELVIGVVVKQEARAYPINMLTGPEREIINDGPGGRSIAATW